MSIRSLRLDTFYILYKVIQTLTVCQGQQFLLENYYFWPGPFSPCPLNEKKTFLLMKVFFLIYFFQTLESKNYFQQRSSFFKA